MIWAAKIYQETWYSACILLSWQKETNSVVRMESKNVENSQITKQCLIDCYNKRYIGN